MRFRKLQNKEEAVQPEFTCYAPGTGSYSSYFFIKWRNER